MRDCPHPLFAAIRHALVILSWEELPREERPPKRIWLDGDALREHFDRVEKARDERYRPGGSGPIDDPRENEAAKSLLVG